MAKKIAGKKNREKKLHRKSQKTVKITHHHAKPFRKRHYGSFFAFVVAALIILILLVQYNDLVYSSTNNAKLFIEQLFSGSSTSIKSVTSTYGFSFKYNSNNLYASAYDSSSGNLYIGDELSTDRQYQEIRLSSSRVNGKASTSQMTLKTSPLLYANESLDAIQANEITTLNRKNLILNNTSTVQINGVTFLKSVWHQNVTASTLSKIITPTITTYTSKSNGYAFTALITQANSNDSINVYTDVLNSITFGAKSVSLVQENMTTRANANKTIFDSLMFSNMARAAATASAAQPASEYISSLYSPSVVKIYNIYCQDISIDGQLYLTSDCNGGVTGSGFFVSSDGYIATNGHVVNSSPKDDVIMDAIDQLVNFDNDKYFAYLMKLANVTSLDLPASNTTEQNLAIVINKFYALSDSRFTVSNNISNLVVTLGQKQPDTTELIDDTKGIKSYPSQSDILHAKVVAKDYRAADGVNGFKASDVALIKIDGSNYPVTRLGSIDEAMQGSNLNILGFPGAANSNGLVNSTQGVATLTSGKVSSTKNAAGNGDKLIETDTVIGHGNSGSPAILDNGDVVGIATYTINGATTSDATFNYVRDIADLKNLAAKSNVNFVTTSKTQIAWQKGIDLFNKAHYSGSIKYFNLVKNEYPAHPTVDKFIADANAQINAGRDIKDFPVALALSGVLFISIVGAGIAFFVIRNHKKKHELYKEHVASGAITPMVPGSAPQYIQPQMLGTPVGPQSVASNELPVNPPTQPTPSIVVSPQPIPPSEQQPVNHSDINQPPH